MVPPFELTEQIQRHAAALRRLAADLVGSSLADDAVQQTWLGALRRPPRDGDGLGPWLATVLRSVVAGWRRGDRRRRAREHAAALARGIEVADHGAATARHELAQRLLAEVEALAEPYRTVIWQRFFVGLPPRAIAAAHGVPVETVKSQQKRGLGMLRERLGAGGGDWRAGLVGAFGLPWAGGGVATGTGNGVVAIMAMVGGSKVWFAAALLAVGIGVGWLAWPAAPAASPALAAGDRAAVAVTSAVDAGAAASGAADAQRPDANAGEPAVRMAVAESALATISGRCVDASGVPQSGVAVRLSGRRGEREQLAAWQRGEAAATWKDPPVRTTGDDGRFVVEFEPVAGFSFDLLVTAAGTVPIKAEWATLRSGARIDLGELTLVPGVAVTGRVVDVDGAPVAKVQVSVGAVAPEPATEGRPALQRYGGGTSASDGTFALYYCLPPGEYSLSVNDGHRLQAPTTVELDAAAARREIAVVLERAAVVASVRGRVLDASGQPIAEARVELRDVVNSDLDITYSERDGSFRFQRRPRPSSGRLQIVAGHDEFEARTLPSEFDWGAEDVVITLERSPNLDIVVHDERGARIDDFLVRVMPRNQGVSSWDDGRVRALGPFADGVARVVGVPRGEWTVVTEFPAAAARMPVFTPIVVGGGAAQRIDVNVPAVARTRCVVQDERGRPVAGAQLQLVLAPPGLALAYVERVPLARLEHASLQGHAIVLATHTTDAEGVAAVEGPLGVDLGLIVEGPAHLPWFRAPVRLQPDATLVIAVTTGASLAVQLGPPTALAAIRELAGKRRGKAADYVMLRGVDRRQLPERHDDPRYRLSLDGACRLGGLPPGTWDVVAMIHRETPHGGGWSQYELGSVVLQPGETATVTHDLSLQVPGQLVGTLLHNGRPLPAAGIQLGYDSLATTAADGSFAARFRPGTFAVRIHARDLWGSADGGTATIEPGQTTHWQCDVRTGEVELRVVDARGQPTAAVKIFASGDGRQWQDLPALDSDGRTTFAAVAQTLRVRTLPSDLQSDAARATFDREARARGETSPELPWLDLGTVTVIDGQRTACTLQLPAAFDQPASRGTR